ncbi:uncharacterized protein LOC106004953 [Mustela putorius furo]|uniref:Uncharacterized protein LOC106004953 n=1 Tax=Mustela putorius furo TaxID=9669 RepID=A0A8U0NNY9_MUSPF|nr:uncharacterized protein LOC106004953 [Mustela putorius furo]
MADNLEPSMFPIQKGSLILLRQKWESSDYQKSECCPGGSRCRLFQPPEKKLLEPKGEVVSAHGPADPPSLPHGVEEALNAEPDGKDPDDKSDNSRESGWPEVLKEDSLTGRRRIERFSIALDELRSVFEAPRSVNRPAEYCQKPLNSIKSHEDDVPVLKVHQQPKGYPEISQHRNSFDNTLRDKLPFTVEKPGRNRLNKRLESVSPVTRHPDIMYLLM